VCLRIVMSNILSYHMSLRSEFRVELSNILSYHMSLRSEFRVEISHKNDVRFVFTSRCTQEAHVLFTLFVFFVCDGVQHILTI
jgi:hypothetical protein